MLRENEVARGNEMETGIEKAKGATTVTEIGIGIEIEEIGGEAQAETAIAHDEVSFYGFI